MKEIWDFGMLQVFLSNTGITTGRPCLFSSSVCTGDGGKKSNQQTQEENTKKNTTAARAAPRSVHVTTWCPHSTCAKYSSEMRPAHSMQSSCGLQGLEMSAHLISIRLTRMRFSGDVRTLLTDSSSLFPYKKKNSNQTISFYLMTDDL